MSFIMTGTRKEVFLHVVNNVICLSPNEIDVFSDSGCDDILCLIHDVSYDFLSSIKNNKQEHLSPTTQARIVAFDCFYWHALTSGQVPTENGWFAPSQYDFDSFCESPHFSPEQGNMVSDIYKMDPCSKTEFYVLRFPFVSPERQAFLHALAIIDLTTSEIQCLETFGVTTVSKLQNMTESQLSLIFSRTNDEDARVLVKQFVCFSHFMSDNGNHISAQDLMQLSTTDFTQFCYSDKYCDYYASKNLDDFHDNAIADSSSEKINTTSSSQDKDNVSIVTQTDCDKDHVVIISDQRYVDTDRSIHAIDSAAVMQNPSVILESSNVLVKHDHYNNKTNSCQPSMYPFIPTAIFALRLGSDGDIDDNSGDATASCLESHRAIISFDDHGDSTVVNVIDTAIITTTFFETTRALDKHNHQHKKNVALSSTLYHFIPTDLFKLRLGSDGDIDDGMSLVFCYASSDIDVETETNMYDDDETENVFCEGCYEHKNIPSSSVDIINYSTGITLSSEIDILSHDIWSSTPVVAPETHVPILGHNESYSIYYNQPSSQYPVPRCYIGELYLETSRLFSRSSHTCAPRQNVDTSTLHHVTLWKMGSYLVLDFDNGNKIIMLYCQWQMTFLQCLLSHLVIPSSRIAASNAKRNAANAKQPKTRSSNDVSSFQNRAGSIRDPPRSHV